MPSRSTKQNIFLMIILLSVWCLLVLYPNPAQLLVSMYRLKNPPVMPIAVTETARELDDRTPCEIREYVHQNLPYAFDWEVHNMPWYFPTLEEALQKGVGDCKARFLLFASLLEELEIPYEQKYSLTHIWVSYEDKPETALENQNELLIVIDESGRARFNIPRTDLKRAWRSFYRGFWAVMPGDKKLLLLAGMPIISGLFCFKSSLERNSWRLKNRL